jgi:hypothetical protein
MPSNKDGRVNAKSGWGFMIGEAHFTVPSGMMLLTPEVCSRIDPDRINFIL